MKKQLENVTEENTTAKPAEENGAQASDVAEDLPKHDIVPEEALEAVLFAAGHPVSYATLARTFNMTPGEIKNIAHRYALEYNNTEIPRGVILLTYPDSCQLCTKEYYLSEIREALGIRKSGSLSNSSLETLAIVAYNQPVTRVFVDTLRRSDSSYAMNNLLDRGLIESVGRLDVPGRPMLYATTNDFLRCFGLKDIDELPKTTEEIVEMFEKSKHTRETEAEQLELSMEDAVPETEKNETENAVSDTDAFDENEALAEDGQEI